MPTVSLENRAHVSLVEAIDRVLNKGAVIAGDVTIAVADIDLIRLDLRLVLASHGTALDANEAPSDERR